jgi:hypothetical protein
VSDIAKLIEREIWERVSAEARRYASHYSEASDGRNTFILFAEWAERQIEPERREGFTHVCTLPGDLGAVTRLKIKGGRVIAETESNADFIVPEPPK